MTEHNDRWDEESATTRPRTEGASVTVQHADPEQSARDFFEHMHWFGVAPDAERLSAREFMRWIA